MRSLFVRFLKAVRSRYAHYLLVRILSLLEDYPDLRHSPRFARTVVSAIAIMADFSKQVFVDPAEFGDPALETTRTPIGVINKVLTDDIGIEDHFTGFIDGKNDRRFVVTCGMGKDVDRARPLWIYFVSAQGTSGRIFKVAYIGQAEGELSEAASYAHTSEADILFNGNKSAAGAMVRLFKTVFPVPDHIKDQTR